MSIRFLRPMLLVALFFGVLPYAQAVWPFNESDTTKAEKLAAQANAQLQAADEVWRSGDLPKAAQGYQAAADQYRQAEQLSPNLQNGLVRFRLSYCASQVEQIQNAAREKAKPEPPVSVTHPSALAREREVPRPSQDEARRAMLDEPVDVRRELAIAQRFIAGDHPADALPSLVKVLRVEPANRRAMLLMATVRVQQGRYDDAIVTIEGVRDAEEDEAVLLLAAGAYCGAGRYFDALLALDKVLKKNPELPQAHINMAYLLLEMTPEKRADAEAYYQHARKLGLPRDEMLETRLGMKP
jgi:tetratricopeptide (TPR) repeat protein